MKYVITDKDDVVIALSTRFNDNKEIRNLELDDFNIAYAPDEEFNVYEVNNVPAEVEPSKYRYDDLAGFTRNPDYVYYYTEEERISALEDMMNEILLGGVE